MDTVPGVPFTTEAMIGGLAEVRGMVRADGADVVLEFMTQDTVVQVFKSALQKKQLPIGCLESIEFRSSWFGLRNVLTIRTRTMESLSGVPASDQNKFVMFIARGDRARAHAFASNLNWKLSERLLNGFASAQSALPMSNDGRNAAN